MNRLLKNLDLENFPLIEKSAWERLAYKQIGGDPHTLSWSPESPIQLNAYYDYSDLRSIKYLPDFFENAPTHFWKIYEEIEVEDEKRTNLKALEALMNGADGIIFDFKGLAAYEKLFESIDFQICDVSFRVEKADAGLTKYLEKCLGFIESKDESNNSFLLPESKNFLKGLLHLIDKYKGEKFIYRQASPDFFFEIALLRAIRYLLFNVHNSDAFSVQIHTHIPTHSDNEHQWFLNTTGGLSSILGGSNSISLTTSVGNSRISINTAHLIREESGIKSYTDQCGGSYYIEVLTHKIIDHCLNQSVG